MNDFLDGGADNDKLFGGSGKDTLTAAGNDISNGGDGDDTLTGGAGLDLFSMSDGRDNFDFRIEDSDKIIVQDKSQIYIYEAGSDVILQDFDLFGGTATGMSMVSTAGNTMRIKGVAGLDIRRSIMDSDSFLGFHE